VGTTTTWWQFRILDTTGGTVATGFRIGLNDTGTTIQWRRNWVPSPRLSSTSV
jgi:hypothetical protein